MYSIQNGLNYGKRTNLAFIKCAKIRESLSVKYLMFSMLFKSFFFSDELYAKKYDKENVIYNLHVIMFLMLLRKIQN